MLCMDSQVIFSRYMGVFWMRSFVILVRKMTNHVFKNSNRLNNIIEILFEF